MNKTLNINLAGFIFHIDENAYLRLEKYLNTLKSQFINSQGGNEIINDIEMRIAELFKERTGPAKEVISVSDVDEVIAIMGQPEDYLEIDDEGSSTTPPPQAEYSPKKRIFRDPDNKVIGGVASGLAAYFNIDALWIRLLFLLILFSGFGFLFYIIMWAVIPKAQTTAEKLQMRGEKINISNIEKSIREEMRGVNDNIKGLGDKVSNIDYRRSGNHLSGFFSDLGNFIGDALRLIFRILGKLIGLFFLFIGFIILLAVVVGLFAGSVEILGSAYGVSELMDFLHLVTVNESHYNLLMAGVILSVVAPFFLLVYLGIRILFNLEPLNAPTRNALSLTTFIGLILLLVAGIKIGLQFDDDASISRELSINQYTQYVLTVAKDSTETFFLDDYHSQWQSKNGQNAFVNVDVDIRKAEGELAYIRIISEANGASRREARINARQIDYTVNIHDSVIEVPYYILLQEGQKFRNQLVEVILYLPEGSSVFIDHSMGELLYDVSNLQNTWDFEMTGKRWIMTEFGLSCEGCEIPERIFREELDEDTDTSEVDMEFEPVQYFEDDNTRSKFVKARDFQERQPIGLLRQEQTISI